MIKQLIYIFIINIITIFSVIADDTSKKILQNRLNKIDNLYVRFIQKINNIDSAILEEYQGELWIKRPNFFYWHMMYPEENFLISDGETLWFYVSSIKQVTAFWIKSVIIDNIFWALITDNNILIWNNYDVSQQGDLFFLQATCSDINIKDCEIEITNCGIIRRFSFVEFNGQSIDYYLSEQNNNEINVSQFFFNIPKDVQLDDQRK